MSVRVAAVVATFAFVLLAGCSGAPDGLPPNAGSETEEHSLDNSSSTTVQGTDAGPAGCTPFETRECLIDLGFVNGVHDCAKGTQICESGTWSACAEPSL